MLALLRECEDLSRLFLQNAGTSLLYKSLPPKAPKIALHSCPVAGVNELCNVIDSNHAELANLRKRPDFRRSK